MTPKEKREYDKQYYRDNQEECRQYNREYHLNHAANIRSRKKRHRLNNIEKELQREANNRSNNREKIRDNNKRYYVKNKERVLKRKKINNLKKYGLSVEEMRRLYISQGGLCPICENKLEKRSRAAIDHNHTTGQIRQLLCRTCNLLIGQCKENVSILSRAIEYLNKWSKP